MSNLTTQERFWAKVEKTGTCWNWTAYKRNGYGRIRVDDRMVTAHRLSYEWEHGPIPDDMMVDHICHNHSCVNPMHLRVATRKENMENRRGAATHNKSSGVRGVHRHGNSWRACVRHNGKLIGFGTYSSIEEASRAAAEGRAELFNLPEQLR